MTNTPLFKRQFPQELLYSFIKNNSLEYSEHYEFNKYCFKRGIYNGEIDNFIKTCFDYYHPSKHSYLTRKMTYSNFMTILRQICKLHNIMYSTDIKYSGSSYEIIYKIYL
jgi:hypothetical protein